MYMHGVRAVEGPAHDVADEDLFLGPVEHAEAVMRPHGGRRHADDQRGAPQHAKSRHRCSSP